MVKVLAYLLSAVVATSSIEEVDHTGLLQTTKHRSNSRSVASRTYNRWQTDDVECNILNLCCKSSFERLKAEGEREIENVQGCSTRISAEIQSEQQAIAEAVASKGNELKQTAEALKATTAALARASEIDQTIADARQNHKVQSEELRAEYQKLEDDFNAVRLTALKVAAFIHAPDLCDGAGQPYGYGTNLLQGKRWFGSWVKTSFNDIIKSTSNFVGKAADAISDAVDDAVDWTCEEVIDKHTDKVCHSKVEDQRDQYEQDLAAAQATVKRLQSELETTQNELTASLALEASARQDKVKQIAAKHVAQDLAEELTENLKTLRENNDKAIAALESDIKVMEEVVSAFKSTFSENLFKEMRTLGATD